MWRHDSKGKYIFMFINYNNTTRVKVGVWFTKRSAKLLMCNDLFQRGHKSIPWPFPTGSIAPYVFQFAFKFEITQISHPTKRSNSRHFSNLQHRLTVADVIKWKHFPRYWPFVRGIHRSPVNSPHKGQWRGALMFTLICARINGWVNNREAGDLRRYRGHCDVTVMISRDCPCLTSNRQNIPRIFRVCQCQISWMVIKIMMFWWTSQMPSIP